MKTVAALFVQTGGCYWGLPGVDPRNVIPESWRLDLE